MAANVERARAYLAAIESGAGSEVLTKFLAPDVVYQELPNRLFAKGRTSTLDEMRAASDKGREILVSQHYEILNAFADGDTVILEVEWTGILKIPFGSIQAGQPLRDRSAIFMEFRDGMIVRQRNYDCYDPW